MVGEFKGKFQCLGKNAKKYIKFLVPIEKLENGKTIKHKERFIDSVRVMASSLSSLADNLAEDLEIGQCKNCKSSLKYITTKDGLRTFDGVNYNKTYEKKFDEDLPKRFENTYQFYDGEINKCCFIL